MPENKFMIEEVKTWTDNSCGGGWGNNKLKWGGIVTDHQFCSSNVLKCTLNCINYFQDKHFKNASTYRPFDDYKHKILDFGLIESNSPEPEQITKPVQPTPVEPIPDLEKDCYQQLEAVFTYDMKNICITTTKLMNADEYLRAQYPDKHR